MSSLKDAALTTSTSIVAILDPDSAIYTFTELRTDRETIGSYVKHTLTLTAPGNWIINIQKVSTPVAIISKTNIGDAPVTIYYSTFGGSELSELIINGTDPQSDIPAEFVPKDDVQTDDLTTSDWTGTIMMGGVFLAIIIGAFIFLKKGNKTSTQAANQRKRAAERKEQVAAIRDKENIELDKLLNSFEGEYVDYEPEVDYSKWTPEYASANNTSIKEPEDTAQEIRFEQTVEQPKNEQLKNKKSASLDPTPKQKPVDTTANDDEYIF